MGESKLFKQEVTSDGENLLEASAKKNGLSEVVIPETGTAAYEELVKACISANNNNFNDKEDLNNLGVKLFGKDWSKIDKVQQIKIMKFAEEVTEDNFETLEKVA